VLKAGVWHLVASSEGKPRTYRISNVKCAAVLEPKARRPARFDLARYWAESVARFESELYTDYADVLATQVGLKNLRYLNAAVARTVTDSCRVGRTWRWTVVAAGAGGGGDGGGQAEEGDGFTAAAGVGVIWCVT
jgi:hypothetical protein